MDAVERLLERLSQALFFVALLAGAAMMLHVTLEAFSRTALAAPLSGTYEVVAAYYMIAAAFLPWAALALRDQHITVELFTERVGRRWRDAMGLFTQGLTIAYMVIFTWQSVVGAQRRMDRGEVLEIPTGYLTVWPARWMLPVVGGLMLACLVFRLAADIRRMARGDHGRA
jgi:TRAP-type C4-dicarboxylate transport system permease small subunit